MDLIPTYIALDTKNSTQRIEGGSSTFQQYPLKMDKFSPKPFRRKEEARETTRTRNVTTTIPPEAEKEREAKAKAETRKVTQGDESLLV